MLINRNTKLADALHHNPLLLPVINRLGVELGFGDMTIGEVCEGEAVDTDFFLLIVNAFLDRDVHKKINLKHISLLRVVEYLKATHKYYLERMMPEVEIRINALVQQSDINQEQYRLVKKFFDGYAEELFSHIELEEREIHPYIIALQKAYSTQEVSEDLRKQIKAKPIEFFARDHSDIESKLTDLKNILIKYLGRPRDSFLRNQVLEVLFKLESDINDHSRIEDKVMVPMVAFLEKHLMTIN